MATANPGQTRLLKTRTRCKACDGWMESGEPFSWMACRVAVGYSHAGGGSSGYKQAFRPRHTFDCLAVKAAHDRAASLEAICEDLLRDGFDPSAVASFRERALSKEPHGT